MQPDLFSAPLTRSPVLVAYGGGVDSTAMIIEMVRRNEPIDYVLMALTKSENPLTDQYVDDVFAPWLEKNNVPFKKVVNKVKNYKSWPIYDGLYENCLANSVLPSIAFGFNSCSCKWKLAPQDKWVNTWDLGQQAIRQGLKITKCIGYDAGPQDSRRYAEREGYVDPRFEYRYPLREWNYDREACQAIIRSEGLPVPPKSSCIMCTGTKETELHAFPPQILRRIVLLEARAFPRLTSCEGLWRKARKGTRGNNPRPGSMTEYIRQQKLLHADEIDHIWHEAPKALGTWQESVANIPVESRPHIGAWLSQFDQHHDRHAGQGAHPPYPAHMHTHSRQAA